MGDVSKVHITGGSRGVPQKLGRSPRRVNKTECERTEKRVVRELGWLSEKRTFFKEHPAISPEKDGVFHAVVRDSVHSYCMGDSGNVASFEWHDNADGSQYREWSGQGEKHTLSAGI